MSGARTAAFLALGYVALLLEGAIAFVLPGSRSFLAVPELALSVIVYLGLCGRGGAPGLVAVALTVGYLRDLVLGAPRGVEALAFALVALCARALHGRVFLERFRQLATVSAALSGVHLGLVAILGTGDAPASPTLRALPGLLVAALLVSPFVLRGLRRIDLRLAPEARAIRFDGDLGGAWR
jgi:rod shape-determining protein MreD